MHDQTAIVTGSSSGIGAAIALEISNKYNICINYSKNEKGAESLKEDIIELGGAAVVIKSDLATSEGITDLFQKTDKLFSTPICALVNNAGLDGGRRTIDQIDYKFLNEIFSINTYAPFLCCREAIDRMKKHGKGGAIVNITSQAAKFGGRNLSHYAAAKSAVNTMTIGLAREVAQYGIRINAISPGIIDTSIHGRDELSSVIKTIPMGRLGEPREVAKAVAWLLSDDASYVSGAVIPVTGSR
ncbi:MAG: SDR family oxidoreductase [Legionellales bacterium]|nr:SDR family oxidoreductase [Legionellales bacterium]